MQSQQPLSKGGKHLPTTTSQTLVNPLTILSKLSGSPKFSENKISSDPVPYTLINQIEDDQQTVGLRKTKIINKANKKALQNSLVLSTQSTAKQSQKHYKTKMCPYGRECRKQFVCKFAHNQYELRKPFKNRKHPCIRYQKGLCHLGAACSDFHGNIDLKPNYKYKTKLCQAFNAGNCAKGQLCINIHELDSQKKQHHNSQSYDNGTNPTQQKETSNLRKQNQSPPPLFQVQSIKTSKINNTYNQEKSCQQQTQGVKKAQQIKEVIEEKIQYKKQLVDEGFNIDFSFQ